jgi:hypothetical protein
VLNRTFSFGYAIILGITISISLFAANLVSYAAYAEATTTDVTISSHSNPVFVFNLRASSSPTGVSGNGIGIVNGHAFKGIYEYTSLSFRYSITSLAISKTTNSVSGKVGDTVYLTATVTRSTDTDKVPIGSTFYITANDPCCATDPSLARSNRDLVIVSFQGPLGGVYTAGEVHLRTFGADEFPLHTNLLYYST